MKRQTAFDLLGGDTATVAMHLGCSRAAVYNWPKTGPLPRIVADRVIAARVRLNATLKLAQGLALDELEEDAVAL